MSSPLQLFAEQVVAEVLGVETEIVSAAVQRFESGETQSGEQIVGIDIIAIIALIEMLMPMIMELINGCNANQKRVNASIRNPGLMQRIVFRMNVNRAVRQGEPRWRNEAHEIANVMIDLASQADEDTVDSVINQCRDLQAGIGA